MSQTYRTIRHSCGHDQGHTIYTNTTAQKNEQVASSPSSEL